MSDHKGHLFGCDGGCGDDQVGFVFAGGVVEDDDEFTIAWGAEQEREISLGMLARIRGQRRTECLDGIWYRVELGAVES